jgi:hypothetical protein
MPGTYDITVSRFGYQETTLRNVEMVGGQTTPLPIPLPPIPRVTVTGTVISSDTNAGITGATVTLVGYDDYEVITNASGEFTISEVFSNNSYLISISKEGYFALRNEPVVVGNTAHNIGSIMLKELPNPPSNVQAVLVGNNMNVSWELPSGNDFWFTHSSGLPFNFIGNDNPQTFYWFNRFSQAHIDALGLHGGEITHIEFFLGPVHTYDMEINIYVGGSGTSVVDINPGTLIHSQPIETLVNDDWNNVELTTPIPIPLIGEIWIGVGGHGTGHPAPLCWGLNYPWYGDVYFWNVSWMNANSNVNFTGSFIVRGYVTGAVGNANRMLTHLPENDLIPTEPQTTTNGRVRCSNSNSG